jgi:heat shock protein HtpX
MIGALERLRHAHATPLPESMQAFGINTEKASGGFKRLFMTHPPLEERIAALRGSAA